MSKQMIGNGMLLLAAMIWGASFVAQVVGLDYVGPFTFLAVRSLLGSLVLLPVIAILDKSGISKKPTAPKEKKTLLIAGCFCGLFLFTACALQQVGLMTTEAGKGGFLTALYIILVPIIGLFFRKKVSPWVWLAVILALIGLYLLCAGDMTMGIGEILLILCAVAFSGHILVIDHFSPHVDGVRLSCLQFFVCGIICLVIAVFTEDITLSSLKQCWLPIASSGILSAGAGYTLQILGQARTEPTTASLLMSLESVFSVLSGWLLIGERLSLPELIGCGLVFAGVVLAQIPSKKSVAS